MCGIAGLILADGRTVDRDVIVSMTETLRHRGPDGSGVFVEKNVGLGHRRLAVIDTSEAANQPLFNEDGSIAVVFNGEIYNFQKIREELIGKGHRFSTRSDTEVLLHSWEEYGPECLDHLRGMFAFCIYDSKKGVAFLARDRLGKKPIFYSCGSGFFAFASEVKALVGLPHIDKGLDPTAVVQFTTYGYSLGERTIYRGIRKLPPGHYAKVEIRTAQPVPQIKRYWEFSVAPDYGPSEEEWLEEMEYVLSDAVRLRLISDVPLGALLSGGVDSSLVAALMARNSSDRVETFNIGFKEKTFDESSYAAAVSRYLGTENHLEIITPNALEILPDLVRAYDEPFGDASAIPTYYLSRMTRQHVTVALSGDGGDETFLGYERYRIAPKLLGMGRVLTPAGKGLSNLAARVLPYGSRVRRGLECLAKEDRDLYNYFLGYRRERLSLLREEVLEDLSETGAEEILKDWHVDGSTVLRFQNCDVRHYLADDILAKVDRASMYHSLEVRCPLLDQDFVELATRIPPEMKLNRSGGKSILKKLARRYLPAELSERPKQGFSVPLNHWFRGDLEGMLKEILADHSSHVWEWYDKEVVSRRIRGLFIPGSDSGAVLWRLVFFHSWCRGHLT
jgi:asparagine synthase (glutamine-hydrolysing)